MTEPSWNIDPGSAPPTRDDAWFPPSAAESLPLASRPTTDHEPIGSHDPLNSPHLESAPAPTSPSLRRRGGPGRLASSALIGLVTALIVGFVAGRATSGSSPSAALAAAGQTVDTQKVNAPAPLTGREVEPAASVAKALSPAAVQLQSSNDLGSGFIYDKSGLILTAAHVVAGHKTMQVRMSDGTQTTGTVVGANSATDVAVLRISVGKNLPVAALAVGVAVQVGQTAIALGSPYGLDQTVTAGIVSAVGRAVSTQEGGEVAMVQTDAPINPGNSGGMLANRFGQVIGVNDSIISGSSNASGDAGNVGVGFAIPITLAKSVADRLVAGQSIDFGYLGVKTADATGSRAGGRIVSVESGSPADNAGLKAGDVVVSVDANPVGSGSDLAAAIRAHRPGDKVKLLVLRGSSEVTILLTVGKAP